MDNLLGYIYDRGMHIGLMYINGFWFEKPSETMEGFKKKLDFDNTKPLIFCGIR